MKSFIILIGLLALMACSREPTIIIQEENEPINEESIELIEKEQVDEENQQYLEFSLLDQQITLNLNNIPVLTNYLEQHSQKEKAIQEMQLTQVMREHFDSIFLLTFACQNNSCSYLLLNTETRESQLLADQAQIVKIESSPNLEHLLIIFKRHLPNEPWDNKLIVYNIEQWTETILTIDGDDLTSLHSFQWPIIDTIWLNDTKLQITLPDIENIDANHLHDWHDSKELNVKKIITKIE